MNKGARLLRAWRERRGVTQTAASEIIGISQSRYSRYENGEAVPSREPALLIRQAARVPVDAWDVEVEGAAA